VTSLVAVRLIFTQLFSRATAYQLRPRTVRLPQVDWEAGRLSSWIALSVMVTVAVGRLQRLIYLAAMQGIPDELYEPAAIDGRKG
jgi:cellobiose transport system permease protein